MYIVNVCIECMHFECMHCESIRGMTTKCQKLVFVQGYGLQILDIAKYPLFCTFWVPMVYIYMFVFVIYMCI